MTDSQVVIHAPDIADKLITGSSIAVDGVCLTVIFPEELHFTADFMPETLKKTVIGKYKTGHMVNLELPLVLNGRIEGHIVTGHVDGTGAIIDIHQEGNSHVLTIEAPKKISRQIATKGSIAVNGISLTVIGSRNNRFTVGIIPHTWENTNLHALKKGDKVNLETDVLAKHLERLIIK